MRRAAGFRAALLLAVALVAACSSSGSDVAHDADAAAPACPGVSTTCPSGCAPLTAFAYDAQAGCVAPHLAVVGCVASLAPSTDEGCVVRTDDGARFRAGSASAFNGVDGWQACDADAGAALATAPRCPR